MSPRRSEVGQSRSGAVEYGRYRLWRQPGSSSSCPVGGLSRDDEVQLIRALKGYVKQAEEGGEGFGSKPSGPVKSTGTREADAGMDFSW